MKWPWNRQQTPSEPPTADQEPAHVPTSARVSQLEADLTALRLEWAEVLDKINRWASRQAARERARTVRELDHLGGDGTETAEDAPGQPNGDGATPSTQAGRLAVKAALRARIRR